IEHYAGAFPTWLAPVQVKILPVTDRANDYAKELEERFKSFGIRVETDLRNEKIGYKIREAQLQKVPYMIILGDKEVEAQNVSVRSRKEGDLGAVAVEDFIAKIKEEIDKKISSL
ncbi:MAG: His/Gly/Thr/Pro-type tRNA ligase C-terminal domain-containing protein, partial [Clostridiales bacterium]|nr:His/Gly/Thr/Pro-type tRNA ligase C-terminal domain-containing protein [Clostridiales bacterium]